MSLFKRVEKRMASVGGPASDWARDVETAAPTASGVKVNPDRARQLVSVWAAQSLVADGVASLPVDTYRREKAKGRKSSVDSPRWLIEPNPFDTPYTFWHKVMISLLGEDGNAFILTPRDDKGQVVSLWVLDPTQVVVDEDSAEPRYTYNGKTYGAKDILHIPAFTVPGQRRGISPIDHAKEAIGLGLAAEEFGARFFSQGTTMAGVVEHPGTPKPGEVAILGKMLRKSHAGLKNSHAVGILTGGATWKSISITPEQAQFLETRRFQNIQIAQIYRVPPHMIDPSVQSSWGSGVEEQNSFFVEYTLVPWLTRLEQAFSRLLVNGQYIKFNVAAKLRAKTMERFQAYVYAVTNGFFTLDEVRALEDMEPIPGGKGSKHYIPMNLQELGVKPEPAPAPKPEPEPKPADDPAAEDKEEESTDGGD
ncbi:phage portal protein [Asanoa sp. WMMD1127]|uniref:phage portal protein n=1 Tax=Asanoa sp. WMMD1127 TaxID=3016107 RepID=UPI0024177947|nr:phage portal protein [Asanoa sp. WMMD1127]MDG4826027.1 phage portal protein [Asanoa sp. WMMD1127]